MKKKMDKKIPRNTKKKYQENTKKKSMKTTMMATMMKLVTMIWTKRIKKMPSKKRNMQLS